MSIYFYTHPERGDREQWVFIHIPRTGGTAVSHQLLRYHQHRMIGPQHQTAREIRQEPLSKDHITVATVRHPVEWLTSIFNQMYQTVDTLCRQSMRMPGVPEARRRLTKLDSWGINGWLERIMHEDADDILNRELGITQGDWRFGLIPHQSDFLEEETLVFKTEDQSIFQRFQMPVIQLNEREGVYSHKKRPIKSRDISNQNITMIETVFADDFARLGY